MLASSCIKMERIFRLHVPGGLIVHVPIFLLYIPYSRGSCQRAGILKTTGSRMSLGVGLWPAHEENGNDE
jgi:hypothetical protein